MGFDLHSIKEIAENPYKERSLTGSIPKFLKMGVSTKADNQEVKQKNALAAIIHEGLESENLDDRIAEYERDHSG